MATYKHSTLARLLFIGMVAALPDAAVAAPSAVEEIADYRDADWHAVMEAGAKKEGAVMAYGTLYDATALPVFEAFAKKYPFIRIEKHISNSLDTVRLALEEFKTRRYTVDVVGISAGGMLALGEAGFFTSHWTPQLPAMQPDAVEPKRLWALDFQSFVSLGYNTKEIAEKDVPKTLDDLLDPRWKDKMAFATGSTTPNWIGATVHDKGVDFLRKLAKQNIRVYKISGRALSNLVVSGEVPLSPTIFNSHMFLSKKKGANVAWRALGTVYANRNMLGLAKNAPHPHAGMLLIDFFQSKEGQTIRYDMGYASGRKDVIIPNPPERVIDLTASPTFNEDFEKWEKLAVEIFGPASEKKK